MPISLIAELIPKNSALFALLDDQYLRGSFRVSGTLSERNSIPVDKRKHGMKVFVQSTDLVYELQSDLTTWIIDRALTSTLQQAYDGGNEIQIIDGKPIIIKNASSEILKISYDNLIEFNNTLKGKDYTSNINTNVITNSSVIVDSTDRTKYRAIQYFYTVTNSDQSGYETGQLYLIHNGLTSSLYAIMGNSIGMSCGIIFSTELVGYNLNLIATTDDSGSFSRIVHLFKIALI